MPLYIISYDDHPTRDYTQCYKLMAEWNAKRLLESFWLADLTGPAEAVREIVSATFGGHASVAVLQLFTNADWAVNARQEGVEWLQQHMIS
jgi:hypothetical protein